MTTTEPEYATKAEWAAALAERHLEATRQAQCRPLRRPDGAGLIERESLVAHHQAQAAHYLQLAERFRTLGV